MNQKGQAELAGIAILALLGVIVLALIFWIWPIYNVWASEQSGKAEFAKAEQNRRIAVEEARAKLDSESLNAQSEVERAKGVAEANKIIGDSLQGNESYLRYLWITHVEGGQNRQVIYVPTEAGLPILESQRLNQPQAEPKP